MKVPLSWLKQFLDLSMSPKEIGETLTLAGIEVDKIETLPLGFTNVVVVEILSVVAHPNAEKLCIATVFDAAEKYQVVCGDLTCRAGQRTALAKIGATIPVPGSGLEGKKETIKRGKFRGVESFGMLCSEQDIGLSEESDAIFSFSKDIPLGTDLTEMYGDVIFEVSLTPNLGHCCSILGIARELSAFLKLPLKHETPQPRVDTSSIEGIEVAIEDKASCHRYSCQLIENITVCPSPVWLKQRLLACGVRSINCVVDISNYVMLERGQPVHFFDYDTLASKAIRITSSHESGSLLTLDDKQRSISSETLLICAGNTPIAFAGVMGGAESAVTEKTKTILIESAFFTPEAVRKSSKKLGLRTEASNRFEKGVDPNGVVEAIDLCAELLCRLASGRVASAVSDTSVGKFSPRTLVCRLSRVNQVLGTALSLREIIFLLDRLGIHTTTELEDQIHVSVPTARHDLTSEIDLVEEIGRLYGFNQIAQHRPRHVSSPLGHHPLFLFERQVRDLLIREGLQECQTCDLISPTQANLISSATAHGGSLISVLSPSSIDQSVLRPSLFAGLLQTVKFNEDHQNPHLSLFEIGRIHFKDQEHYQELSTAAFLLTGHAAPYHWDPKPRLCDFFDLKGMVENVLDGLGISSASFEASHLSHFHPGRQARLKIKGESIGVLGEVHPSILSTLDISERVVFAELNLHALLAHKKTKWETTALPSFPGSERDWTVTLKEDMPIGQILAAVYATRSPLLEKVILLDLYKSEQIGKDRKNATFRFFFRDLSKTLSQQGVEEEHAKIIEKIKPLIADI